MKKLSILFIVIAIIGCTRTDGNIIGTWQSVGDQDQVTSNPSMASVINIRISESGRFKRTTTIIFNNKKSIVTERGSWTKEGDTITFKETSTESGKPLVTAYTVKELSDNTLILSATENTKKYEWRYKRIR